MSDSTRRILDEFGSDSSIEGLDRDIRPGDVLLMVPAVVAALVVWQLAPMADIFAVEMAGLVLGGLFPLLAVVLVYVTPEGEVSALSWVLQMVAFWRSDKELSTVDANPLNRTDTLTQVSRFHPEQGALERTDGELVGAVQVQPANMSLATDMEWNAAADALGDALSTLDFGIFIHSTGRNVDAASIVHAYDGREFDPDVAHNDTLYDLVTMYQDFLPQEFESTARNLSVREYYILVPVGEGEIQLEGYGPFGKLANVPVLGGVIGIFTDVVSGLNQQETRVAQYEELRERIEDVEGAIQGIDGLSTGVLSAEALAGAIQEFWTGERSEYNDEKRMRSVPVVVSETNAINETE